jgi:hypothetical protein|tara:strand:+ start:4501 stop:4827 length:327 start_codon:yes stop_codon:yes gene_type:complete
MFYVYEKSSTYIIGKPDRNGVAHPDHRQSYKTMASAKAGLTRIKKAENLLPTDPNYADFRYAIAESTQFHKVVEKTITKKNMMNGKEFKETVNTPHYCSPSSETYWSM